MAGDTIGSWDSTTLTRFVSSILTNQPAQQLPNLIVDSLIILKKLNVADQSAFTTQQVYNYIGGTATPAFKNSWVNFGSPWDGAGYLKTVDGYIKLHGKVKTGTIGSPMFTLPPGFRPSTTVTFAVASNGALGIVDVAATGDVTAQTPSNNTYVSLDGIAFKTAVS